MIDRRNSIKLLPAVIFLILSFFIIGILGEWHFETIDINIYDTYLVISPLYMLIWVFCLPLYFFYLGWIVLERGKTLILFAVFIISNFILLVAFPNIEMLIELIALVSFDKSDLGTEGWTIYPPLSGLPEEHHIAKATKFQFWVANLLRGLFVLTFGISIFVLGRFIGKRSHEK